MSREHPHWDTQLFRELMEMPSMLEHFKPCPFKYCSHHQRNETMTTRLSVFTGDVPVPPEEICLALEARGTGGTGTGQPRLRLHVVDSVTGEHVKGGNIMSIFPDGTFKLIPGCKFGNKRGFTERKRL